MPDHADARRTVSADDIARLAGHFDRFMYADDPMSQECKEAEIQFNNTVHALYEKCVVPHYQSVSLNAFRAGIVTECRQFLNREKKSASL